MEDCPSWERGLQDLYAGLQLESIDANVKLIRIRNEAEAAHFRFLGSLSFGAGGQELWPEECKTHIRSRRIYVSPEGAKGWPSVEMLRKKLQER